MNLLILDERDRLQLRDKVKDTVDAIFSQDPNNLTERESLLSKIDKFNYEASDVKETTSPLLTLNMESLRSMDNSTNSIGSNLTKLSTKLKTIDPKSVNFSKSGSPLKLLDPVWRYFERFKKVEGTVTKILDKLNLSMESLRSDFISLGLQEQYLLNKSLRFEEELKVSMFLEEEITKRLEEEILSESTKTFIEDSILYTIKRGIQDKQQMLLITNQGIVSLRITKQSNKDMIDNLYKARYVAKEALETGLSLMVALYNQDKAIKLIQATNEMSNEIIERNSSLLKEQSEKVERLNSQPLIQAEKFKKSFNNLTDILASIGNNRQKEMALIKNNITEFNHLISNSKELVNSTGGLDNESISNGS